MIQLYSGEARRDEVSFVRERRGPTVGQGISWRFCRAAIGFPSLIVAIWTANAHLFAPTKLLPRAYSELNFRVVRRPDFNGTKRRVFFGTGLTMNLRIVFVALVVSGLVCSSGFAQPAWHTEVGYIQVLNEFGLVADGTGVVVAQMEAGVNFLPDSANAEFSGKTITQGSPGSSTPSNHATNVGIAFYGNTGSIAPGITDVTGISASDWLNNKLGFLLNEDPLPQNFAISNHSYIVNGLTEAVATNLLQRIDFAINQTGMIAVAGLNNAGNPQPQLLAHSYNAISVGLTSGNHSLGTTTVSIYGPGRTKPDIVAPGNTTSIATGRVSSGAAFLYDAANGSNATQPEALKAILLAGATKSEFLTWDRTTTRPLDEVFGAGEMNVYNSYRILVGGEQNGSTTEPIAPSANEGWDYNPLAVAATPIYYDLQVAGTNQELSVILDWNIDVIDGDASGTFDPSTILANMDLRLYNSTGSFLNSLLDSSLSTVDNVEHIYQANLGPGRYTLEVSSDIAHDYGIAWRVRAIPEPSQWLAMVGASAVLLWFVRRQRQLKQCVPALARKS